MNVVIKTKPIKLVFSNIMPGRSFLADNGETVDWRYANGKWLNTQHGYFSINALVSYFGYSCDADHREPFRFRVFLDREEQIAIEIEGSFDLIEQFPNDAEFFTRTSKLDLRYFKALQVQDNCYQLFEYDRDNDRYWMANPFDTVRVFPIKTLFEDIVITKPKLFS